MRWMRRVVATVRGWWTLPDRIEATTQLLRSQVDELEHVNRRARGGANV